MSTKTVFAVLGFATLIASPAFAAQKPVHHQATYASAAESVVSDGRVVGTDPDPAIRSELSRDASTYTSSN